MVFEHLTILEVHVHEPDIESVGTAPSETPAKEHGLNVSSPKGKLLALVGASIVISVVATVLATAVRARTQSDFEADTHRDGSE